MHFPIDSPCPTQSFTHHVPTTRKQETPGDALPLPRSHISIAPTHHRAPQQAKLAVNQTENVMHRDEKGIHAPIQTRQHTNQSMAATWYIAEHRGLKTEG